MADSVSWKRMRLRYAGNCRECADWPLIGGAFVTQQVKVLWPKKAVETITQAGTLDAPQIDALHGALAGALPPA